MMDILTQIKNLEEKLCCLKKEIALAAGSSTVFSKVDGVEIFSTQIQSNQESFQLELTCS